MLVIKVSRINEVFSAFELQAAICVYKERVMGKAGTRVAKEVEKGIERANMK